MRCSSAMMVCWDTSWLCVAASRLAMSVCLAVWLARIVPSACRLLVITESVMSTVAPWAAICNCPATLALLYPGIMLLVFGTLTCWYADGAPFPVFEIGRAHV